METTDWFRIPTREAEKYRMRRENRLRTLRKYNENHPERQHDKPLMKNREFIVWDGEGPRDTGYSLLGNSEGEELCYPSLKTVDCLDFLLGTAESHPYSIHISFAFGYDVSNILRELSWRHLAALHKYSRCVWRDYQIEHVPRKWFKIQRNGVSIKIYDVFGYFQQSLIGALESWEIGPFAEMTSHPSVPIHGVPSLTALQQMSEPEVVCVFKTLRSEFLWKDIEPIRYYMRLELKYTKLMMEKLREVFHNGGYYPVSWHGPASLARQAFSRHNVYNSMAVSPADVQIGARYAFFGGRFEPFVGGHVARKVFVADINSAYPYYCSQLPNLANGEWRRVKEYHPGMFGLYRIRYESKPASYDIHPLPYRDQHHNVVFPHRTEGWYWNPEAELVRDNPAAEFLDGWIYIEADPLDRPFSWIPEYYRNRQTLKRLGNPAQLTFKLIINSAFGVLAQRSGWNQKKRTPPKTHQLEWAGWITSSCRAAVYRVALECGENLISIDTDGVTSLTPFNLSPSDRLGEWELDEYEDGIFWQSGIYMLKKDGEWKKNKTRGISKGSYSPEHLLNCLETGTPLTLSRSSFVTYGLALNGRRDELNTWKTEPVVYEFGGSGKRQHVTRGGVCPPVCKDGIHRFALPSLYYGPFTNPVSHPHKLPWLGGRDNLKEQMDDFTYYSEEEYHEIQEA